MSTVAVARKDFRAVRRSWMLWAVAVFLGIMAALFAYVSSGYNQTPAAVVRQLFVTLSRVLAILLPLVALVASYLAIAGERESGGIKFLLSLPNTRRDVFLGKLASRLAVVAGAVLFMYVAAVSVGMARHGVIPVMVAFGTLLVTVAYAWTFVSIAVSLSAAAATRSRAIASALVSYLVLVILYALPFFRVPTMVRWVHTTMLGADPNPDLYNAVQFTSPYVAYRKATNLVVPADLRQVVFRSSLPDDMARRSAEAHELLPVYLTDEFSLVVLAFWLVVPLLVGYWLFERSDLE